MAAGLSPGEGSPGMGLVVIQRLHRMVRHGYRPWLGYDVASLEDRDVHLRGKGSIATIRADGAVVFSHLVDLAFERVDAAGEVCRRMDTIAGDDAENFDSLFPPNRPNKRNLMRRLYEIGFLGG